MNFGFGFLGNGLGCLRKEKKKEESWRRRREELFGEEDGEMSFVLGFFRLGRGEWDGRWRKKKTNEGRRKLSKNSSSMWI